MATILDKIIDQKKKEVRIPSRRKPNIHRYKLSREGLLFKSCKQQMKYRLYLNLSGHHLQKESLITRLNHPIRRVLYEEYGASAISVLTDQTFFKGSFSDLRAVRSKVNLPILCKDFIIDRAPN